MENEDSRSIWCGNLSDKVTEELLYELFLQIAPIERLRIPQDKNSGRKCNYAFVTFKHIQSVPYVVQLLNGISVFEKNLIIKPRSNNQMNVVQASQANVRPITLGNRNMDLIEHHPLISVNETSMDKPGSLNFQNLLQMGQMMNSAVQNSYSSTFVNRPNDYRDRSARDYRREDNLPYGRNRNDRYGRNNDRNYENYRRNRQY